MKKVFKFGFLGLALSVAVAACNSTGSQTEETADSLANEIEAQVDSAIDTLDSIGGAAIDSVNAAVDSL